MYDTSQNVRYVPAYIGAHMGGDATVARRTSACDDGLLYPGGECDAMGGGHEEGQ